jgi:hypothetical protein
VLGKAWTRRALEYNRRVALIDLLGRVKASKPGRGTKSELRAALAGAGYAIVGFADLLWAVRKQSREVRDFLTALRDGPETMVPALRVATWTLLAHRFAITRPSELDGLIENATHCIGIENEQERWVATFGPIPEDEGKENRHAIFIFGSGQKMIEATLGREVEREPVSGALLRWSIALQEIGTPEQHAELENKHLAGLT